ncbi:MAG: hypothetical protein ABI379_05640 [Rhodanobacter sp.]
MWQSRGELYLFGLYQRFSRPFVGEPCTSINSTTDIPAWLGWLADQGLRPPSTAWALADASVQTLPPIADG